MSFPPRFLCLPGEKGERFSGSFLGAQCSGDLFTAELLGTGQHYMFLQKVPCQNFTVYDAIVQETEPCFLGLDGLSKIVPHVVDAPFSFTIKEVCAGMGGIGLGSVPLGGSIVASLDVMPLACQHLERNQHGQVLLRDLGKDHAKGELHELGGHACILTSGFPCQPHSTQGMRLGAADPRHQTFIQVLRTAYLFDCSCLLLECTPQAQYDTEVRRELEALASIKQWQIQDLTLALSQQWPCRRQRWWALLTPSSWPVLPIAKWPVDETFNRISSILPGWGQWHGVIETQLQLTEEEYRAYANLQNGQDKRLLELEDQAPTFLHSYSNALSPCPCGCRTAGFSSTSLAVKGLRGCFIISKATGQPRYLHPAELGALLGFPQTVIYSNDVRAENSLLGQSASPLQALWIFSFLGSQIQGEDADTAFSRAKEYLGQYQRQLVRDNFRIWGPSQRPEVLNLRTPDGTVVTILAAGNTTVAQLLHAETFVLEHGEMMHIMDGPRILPAHQILLANGAYGPYCIEITHPVDQALLPDAQRGLLMLGLNHHDNLHVIMVHHGSFLFEALQQEGLAGISHCIDSHGHFFGLDFRFWGSILLTSVPYDNGGTSNQQVAFGKAYNQVDGLSDKTIWTAMLSMCRSCQPHYDELPLLIPPTLAAALADKTASAFHTQALRALFRTSNGFVYCIFAAKSHWALLCGHLDHGQMLWTYFDGLHSSVERQANGLAWALCKILGLDFCPVESFSHQPQTQPNTCGTIALMHLCLVLGLSGHFTTEDECALHDLLLRHQGPKFAFTALGRPTAEVQDKLKALLADKGVPAEALEQRIIDAVKTLGNQGLQEALNSKTPWATLKGLASRPSTRFRWVLPQELKSHIEVQSKKKHGALIPNAKQKKSQGKSAATPQVDPATLQLIPGTFVDVDGDEIAQLDFEDVTQDATGLAFATFQQAKHFIDSACNLSTTTLGLLIPVEIPKEYWGDAEMEHLRFPALCTATHEPMLISGTLLNLSDGSILRKECNGPDIKTMETSILKVLMFQDELQMDWQQVTAGPIRALLQLVPLLRLCSGNRCGKDCPMFHPPVGESIPSVILDLWSRAFHNSQGKNTKPEHAAIYQVMLRVPEFARDGLLRILVKGVYIEPRATHTKGPHSDFGIIWLPGADREQALHRLRTSTHGLAITRLQHRYGIRVNKANEQLAHKELKPDEPYVAVEVRKVYSLYPLPHGLSRAQVSKLLASWEWLARPLQPSRGTTHGQTWLVGSEQPPPQAALPGFGTDVLITLQKDATPLESKPTLVASQRTRKFLREGQAATLTDNSGQDPWLHGPDPWAPWKPSTSTASSSAGASRIEKLQETIKDEIQKQVQAAPPGLGPNDEIKGMQVSIAELQAQGKQYQAWFKEAGSRLTHTEGQLVKIQQVMEQQHIQTQQRIAEVHSEMDNRTSILQNTLQGSIAAMSSDLDSKLSSQFDRFEALLAKKSRSE